MTNIWTKSFEEVRRPFFEIEDPYTLREKKEKEEKEDKPKRWWDDDGDGIGYEKGEVSSKFKKKKVKEEVEQIDEISQKTATRAYAARKTGEYEYDTNPSDQTKSGEYKSDVARARIKKRFGDKAAKHADRAATAQIFGRGYLKKEEVESLVEVETHKSSKEVKLDVRKGIKNKIDTAPKLREEIEEWIGELVEEGYDLSQFTLDEIVDIYESADAEQLDEQMPAQGDAQRVDATDDRMLSAKRRAAQAQIRADLARVQLQKAAVTKESFDSIVEYLSQRPDAFENLEEGVFDPKKSKLRSASERSKTAVTDAQRKAAAKEAKRTAEIHSKGETVLAGLRSSGTRGRVKTTPEVKPETPKANRRVKGRYDKLASAANKVLKDLQN